MEVPIGSVAEGPRRMQAQNRSQPSKSLRLVQAPMAVSLRLWQGPPSMCSARPLVAKLSNTARFPGASVHCSKLGTLQGAPKSRNKAVRSQSGRSGIKGDVGPFHSQAWSEESHRLHPTPQTPWSTRFLCIWHCPLERAQGIIDLQCGYGQMPSFIRWDHH